MNLDYLPVDLFLQCVIYLSFSDVISLCSVNTTLHNYGHHPKYSIRWKYLIDRIYSDPPEIETNYLTYTQLIHKLDPVSQLMIYYRHPGLDDVESWQEKFTQRQKFIAVFMLNKKTEIIKYLPNEHYLPFIEMMDGKMILPDILNKMGIEMAMHGHMNGLLLMEKRGADVFAHYNLALQLASEGGHLTIVKYIMEKRTNDRDLPHIVLRYACKNGHLPIIKYIIEKRLNDIQPVLYFASSNGHLSVVKYSVEQGANIHHEQDLALRIASQNGHLSVVKYLTEQGGDIYACHKYGLRMAREYKHSDVVEFLESLL